MVSILVERVDGERGLPEGADGQQAHAAGGGGGDVDFGWLDLTEVGRPRDLFSVERDRDPVGPHGSGHERARVPPVLQVPHLGFAGGRPRHVDVVLVPAHGPVVAELVARLNDKDVRHACLAQRQTLAGGNAVDREHRAGSHTDSIRSCAQRLPIADDIDVVHARDIPCPEEVILPVPEIPPMDDDFLRPADEHLDRVLVRPQILEAIFGLHVELGLDARDARVDACPVDVA
mmetsp:Transcript_46419/g.109036  ORF Transcript_46419/g.109036 Transcript_46419/m.109036 type:complete len:232 (+) Transcript_46419:457-1152(+)